MNEKKDIYIQILENLKNEVSAPFVDSLVQYIKEKDVTEDTMFELFFAESLNLLVIMDDLEKKAQGYNKLVDVKNKYNPKIEEIENKVQMLEGQLNRTTPVTNYSEED